VRRGELDAGQRPGDVDRLGLQEPLAVDAVNGWTGPAIPALLTTQLRPPNVSAVSALADSTLASSVTSVSTASVRSPSSIRSTVS
jgi:hypothetical protein